VLLGRQPRGSRFNSHAKAIGLWNGEIELLKSDDPSGRVLDEHNLLAGFLANVFLMSIAEPHGEGLSLAVVEHTQFGHSRIPSLISSVG
jgi:hypothetical protein